MAAKLSLVRPLVALVQAEKRVSGLTERDFAANPWMMGENVTFWTVERVAALKAENERLRRERK